MPSFVSHALFSESNFTAFLTYRAANQDGCSSIRRSFESFRFGVELFFVLANFQEPFICVSHYKRNRIREIFISFRRREFAHFWENEKLMRSWQRFRWFRKWNFFRFLIRITYEFRLLLLGLSFLFIQILQQLKAVVLKPVSSQPMSWKMILKLFEVKDTKYIFILQLFHDIVYRRKDEWAKCHEPCCGCPQINDGKKVPKT